MPPEGGAAPSGALAHYRALESLYAAAPINALFESQLEITGAGEARIRFRLDRRHFHAGGAVHGTSYFKMLDDAAFYAANTLVTDRFLLTTQFNLLFTRPLGEGWATAEGRWVSGQRRVLIADARLIDASGEEVARGTGTFMRSRLPLSTLAGYRPA
ncbi:PaaI family thioesterase [Sphingomonas sp.]|uniref:PaaI family thioesterase n=1 Tax=Sphingomonas sp. TaxID=28214 RepID=UPI001DA4D11F|nr:PaaI family thioesterase [Sphingomonas sp.]MBX9795523.1 PaaI family thioesterase [Sphingomonas sp.]